MPKRVLQLDALRAVALFLVLGYHVTWHPLLLRCGWSGVELFFVLSGFLIAGLLFREYKIQGRLRIGNFLLRRGLKIYPAYYLLLGGTVISELYLGRSHIWDRTWSNLLFVQNFHTGLWGHLWSLATEEQFYVLLPCLLALLAAWRRLGAIPGICGSIVVLSLAARSASVLGFIPFAWLPGAIRGFDGLALGVLLSYYHEFYSQYFDRLARYRKRLLIGSLLGTGLTVVFPLEHVFMRSVGLSLVNFAYAGVLLFCLHFVTGRGRALRVVGAIGSYSYTIYLFHSPVAHYLLPLLRPYLNRDLQFLAYLALSAGVGVLITELLERPVLRLRERMAPLVCRSGIQPAVAGAVACAA